MPRLSPRDYLKARKRLRRYWDHQQMGWSYLSSTEQWQLHDFFKPVKDWTDEQAIAHREVITKERPSLPHQAGRASTKLDEIAPRLALVKARAAAQPPVASTGSHSKRRSAKRQITVRSVVKPEIDTERLARALLAFALQNPHDAEPDGAPGSATTPS